VEEATGQGYKDSPFPALGTIQHMIHLMIELGRRINNIVPHLLGYLMRDWRKPSPKAFFDTLDCRLHHSYIFSTIVIEGG